MLHLLWHSRYSFMVERQSRDFSRKTSKVAIRQESTKRRNSKSLRRLRDYYYLHFLYYFDVNDLENSLEAKRFFALVFVEQSFSKLL